MACLDSQTPPPLISIRNLDKSYGRRKVLSQLHLDIPKGSLFALLGPNGCGKTTLLSLILGLTEPNRGKLVWADTGRPSVGALIETPNFHPELSAWDNLGILGRIQKLKEDDRPRVLRILGLMDRSRDAVRTYSLGMKQRLGLAAALLGSPDLLLLDEPHNGMDPAGIRATRDLLLDLNQKGVTILLASHMLGEVEKICTHLAVIHGGQILVQGPRETLIPKGQGLLVRGSDISGLYRLLRAWPELDKVEITGPDIRVYYRPPITISRIYQYCLDHGQELTFMKPIEEDLETYYLHLTSPPP